MKSKDKYLIKKRQWIDGLSDGLELNCCICRRKPIIDYSVTDILWNEIIPKEYQKDVVCLHCLSTLCDSEKLLNNIIRIQIAVKNLTLDVDSFDAYLYNS